MVENGREGRPETRSREADVRNRNSYLLRRQTAVCVYTARHKGSGSGSIAWRVVLRLTHGLPAQEAASGESVRGEQ
jgi:hypothetical protein